MNVITVVTSTVKACSLSHVRPISYLELTGKRDKVKDDERVLKKAVVLSFNWGF